MMLLLWWNVVDCVEQLSCLCLVEEGVSGSLTDGNLISYLLVAHTSLNSYSIVE
jgi:hypothetical protein